MKRRATSLLIRSKLLENSGRESDPRERSSDPSHQPATKILKVPMKRSKASGARGSGGAKKSKRGHSGSSGSNSNSSGGGGGGGGGGAKGSGRPSTKALTWVDEEIESSDSDEEGARGGKRGTGSGNALPEDGDGDDDDDDGGDETAEQRRKRCRHDCCHLHGRVPVCQAPPFA